ncbi:MAG: acyltransferase [Bacteroidales bacterium]|nr:acyltransferase [Bacteroidales bacterium]
MFSISSIDEFNDIALEIFDFQYRNCNLYRSFVDFLKIKRRDVNNFKKIPFLPIEFFKNNRVYSSSKPHEKIFSSSGTTSSELSNHYIADLSLYYKSFRTNFELFYGDIKNYCVLALLPSYLERKDSSLVFMVRDLINRSNEKNSGFYLDNYEKLAIKLNELNAENRKVLLIGVSFALLDLAEQHSFNLPDIIVMETGGMKGRRKEITRNELHRILCKCFNVSAIHSEYGMTELLSQAYSKGGGMFNTPPWMKILIRDVNDPLTLLENNRTGGINIIDLANFNSCSFIATQDLGKLHNEGSFEVLGRFDVSDIRGCNLMIE